MRLLFAFALLIPQLLWAQEVSPIVLDENPIKNKQVENFLNKGKHQFRSNAGQWEEDIMFRCVSSSSSISFSNDKISFGLRKPKGLDDYNPKENQEESAFASEFLVWDMKFIGANSVAPVASMPVYSNINYFGPQKFEGQKIGSYEALEYSELYEGIDLKFYNHSQGALKYDFIVHAGSDIQKIQLAYDGIESLSVDKDNQLIVQTAWGDFAEQAPYSYQIVDGDTVEVDVAYVVQNDVLSYAIKGDYNPLFDLVIDPIYVDWSTYFYGTGASGVYTWAYTYIDDLDMDDDFDVYIAGRTSDFFPASAGGYDTSVNGYFDAFICKMNRDGDSLIWFSYIGGSSYEFASAMSVNSNKEPVMCGMTWSGDFPVTANAYDKTGAGISNYKSFVTKFSADGSKLLFSTYLGGTGYYNSVKALEIGSKGEIYLVGGTNSTNFPTTTGCFQSKFGGGSGVWYYERDAFFTIMKSDGSDLLYSTYIGGAGNDEAYNLALTPKGDIYIVGKSGSNNFYITSGSTQIFNNSAKGDADGFIMKWAPNPVKLTYSHLMGGSGTDIFEGIYVNEYDEPYVAGYSNSGDFPVKNAYQKTNKGGYDQVIVKMISPGTNVRYSTYLGGTGDDYFYDGYWYYTFPNIRIAANIREEAIICGLSKSSDYPVTSDALQLTNKSASGGYAYWRPSSTIAKLSMLGDKLLYASYWGGSGYEYPGAVRLKRVSCYTNILYGGMTTSDDYPTTEGVYHDTLRRQNGSAWTWSGFVTRFRDTLYTDPIVLANLDTIVECDKVYVIVDAENQGADILWSTGKTSRYAIIEDTGTFWVRATYGCDTTSDTLTVKLEHYPKIPVFGNDSLFCDNFNNQLLDAKNDTIRREYKWGTGETTQKYTATSPGKYWVDIITPNCGTKTDTINFTLKKSPKVGLGSDTVACDSVNIVLDAGFITPDMKYKWSTEDSSQSIRVKTIGDYWVKMSNQCGIDSSAIKVTKLLSPKVDLPADTVFCDNIDMLLKVGTANNGESYLWRDKGLTVSYGINDSLRVQVARELNILIENKCGSASDVMSISKIKTPKYGNLDTSYHCDVVSQVLAVNPKDPDAQYTWQNGSTSDEFQANSPGNYKVVVDNKCGKDSMRWMLVLKKSPTVSLPNDSSYCNTINVALNVDILDPEATYTWQDGDKASNYTINTPGKYVVIVSNRCGVVSDSVSYELITNPVLNLGKDLTFCGAVNQTDYSIGTNDNEETYLWSDNSIGQNASFSTPGWHWAQISNKCATRRDSVRFVISQFPIVDLGLDTILCGNFNLSLDAGNPGASYRWEPYGENTQKIKVNEQITYRVFVTNGDGCESSDEFTIGKDCISSYWIPNSFSPNDDQLNDVFRPQLVNYERFSLVIFNRWGEILFESQSPDQGWDGTYQGLEVPNGIYFFNMRFITTENSEFVTQSGQIHLLR